LNNKVSNHRPVNAAIPGFGLRSLKTALATALLATLYLPFERNPTFACMGVIFGMGNNLEDSKISGGNRLIGTIIGGLLGLGLYLLESFFYPEGNYYFKIIAIFVGVIMLVCSSVTFKWPGAVQPGGVMLCIILFYTTEGHFSYAFGRMFDTAIGVIFALFINRFLTRERVDRWLRRNVPKIPAEKADNIKKETALD